MDTDAGFDENVEKDVEALDGLYSREEPEEEEFLAPSRWWFASTAFPLIAGTFGPMASAFSICALAVPWRVSLPPGGSDADGLPVDDPSWLVGINAAQLAIALVANLFLLLNMARRVKFSIAQPITIIGWYLSSFTLIGLTATAAGPLKLGPNHALNQAFWYAIISAGLYFLVATMMVVTVFGAYTGRYDRDFKLTLSQRTLMLQTISFLVYLLAGSAVFAHIESWEYLDAVYWADFTLLTVGIGDLAPLTHLGRSLLFPFAIGGIIILGLVVGSIRSLVIDRGKVKVEARMVEKERERILKKVAAKDKSILVPISSSKNDASERKRREKEFNIMREIQESAVSKRRWMSLTVSGSTWFILWFAGGAIFQATEYEQGWSYFESIYFAYTSLLTIGYGDYSPISNAGKPFFVFWSLLVIPSLTILISDMGDTIVKVVRDLTLWVGNLTVLPGEVGIRAGIKETARKLTQIKIFSARINEIPPGILGEMSRRGSEDSDRRNDPDSVAQEDEDKRAKFETAKAKKEAKSNDKDAMPKSKREYHCILIREISHVTEHLMSNPPRKYTFDEWAWYLKLIGEDESDSKTHREATRNANVDEVQTAATTYNDKIDGTEKRVKWSWMGLRSPLMGNVDEAQWVLDRLIKTLNRELKSMREEELKSIKNGPEGKTMSRKQSEDPAQGGARDAIEENSPTRHSSQTVTN